jgi:Secretion system C-terminal sorting domain
MLMLAYGQASAQTAGDYQTDGAVDFLSATNWLRYNGAMFVAAPSAPVVSDGVITILSGHTATVSASITLDQLSVETGGTLVVNGGVELTVADGTGTDLYVNGTLDVQGTNGAINCPGQFELAVGAKLITANENGVTGGAVIDIAGTGTLTWANNTDYVLNGTVPQTANLPTVAIIRNIEINNTSGVAEGQSLVFSLSGTLTLTAGTFDITGAGLEATFTSTMPIANTGTGTIITDASNVITFGGISGYTIPNKFASAIGTINITNTSTVTFNQSFTILNALNLTAGVLNISGQTLTFDGTTPATLNRTAGTLTTSNTSNIVINENVAGFTFPNDAFTTAPTLGNLTINRSGGVMWGNQALTVNGTLVLTAGLFNMNGQDIRFQNGTTSITRTTGTVTVSNVTIADTFATVTIPAGAFTANTMGALTIDRMTSDQVIFNDASLTITGQLTIIGGVLNISGKVLILNNSIAEPIASTGAGTIVSDASTVLIIRGSGDYTFPTYAFTSSTCLGNITIERDGNGTTAIPFTLEGTLTMDNTALTASKTLTFSALTVQNGAVPFAYTGSGTFAHNFIVTSLLNVGTVGNEGGGAVLINLAITTTINVRRTAGVLFGFVQASSVNIAVGDANIGSLTTDGLSIGTGVVTITSDMSVNFIVRSTGTLTVSPTSNITFTGTGDITLPDDLFTTAPAVINNLTMNRTNAVDITKWNNQGLLVNGILTLTKGVLDISDMSFTNSFTFGGSDTPIVRNGTTETGTITTGFNTFMSFTGTGAAFTIPNNAFTFAPSFPIGFLVINRTNNVSLGNQGLAVAIAVQLTSTGKLNLKGNNIVLVGSALISESYADNGVIYDATATSNTAPGGYIEVIAPPAFVDGVYTSVAGIGLEIEGAATVITNVRRYHYPASSANMGKGIKRAYDITGTPAMGVTDLRITYASSELNGINDAIASDMYLSRWTSATGWESFQHNGINVIFTTNIAPAPNTIEIKDMTTGFSTWTVSASPAPLPITLLGLKGERVAGGQDNRFTEEVRLAWSTASEINNKGFEVEMSADGRNYEKIAFVEGANNSTTIQSYSHTTIQPYDRYYRLRQVDFDGKFSYSPVVFVEGLVGKVVVYPNPNNGKFTISVGKDKLDSPARLLNAVGKEVWRGMQTEVRTTGLPTGVYFLHTIVAGKTKITKVVIM